MHPLFARRGLQIVGALFGAVCQAHFTLHLTRYYRLCLLSAAGDRCIHGDRIALVYGTIRAIAERCAQMRCSLGVSYDACH